MDQLGLRIDVRRPPVADPEVERRAEDHHDVGTAERLLAGLEEPVRVVGIEAAARLSVHVDRHAERAHEVRIGLATARPEELAADEADGALGPAQELEGARHEPGVRPDPGFGPRLLGRDHLPLLDLLEEEVERHLEEDRTGDVRRRDAKGGGNVLAEPAGVRHRHGPLGDRPHHVDVRHLLEAAHVLEEATRLPADHDDRDVGAPRGGDAGDGVGSARAGGDERHARLAGDPRPAVGGVRRRLLVTDVDHADALVEAAVVDRHDVPAAEREHVRHALAP